MKWGGEVGIDGGVGVRDVYGTYDVWFGWNYEKFLCEWMQM